MIKAGDLQLGNKIIDQHGDVVTVIKIAAQELDLQFEDMTMKEIDPDLCDPIPLTPEWLERCGLTIEQREKLGKSWVIHIMPSAKRVSKNLSIFRSGA